MDCRVRQEADFSIVCLEGDLTFVTSDKAWKAIKECLGEDRHVAVDLSAVHHMDTSGIATMVDGFQTAESKGLRFCLVGITGQKKDALELTRLAQEFTIFESLEECLASYA